MGAFSKWRNTSWKQQKFKQQKYFFTLNFIGYFKYKITETFCVFKKKIILVWFMGKLAGWLHICFKLIFLELFVCKVKFISIFIKMFLEQQISNVDSNFHDTATKWRHFYIFKTLKSFLFQNTKGHNFSQIYVPETILNLISIQS